MSRIVNTDNFGRDYPDESFLSMTDSKGQSHPLHFYDDAAAQLFADQLNGPLAVGASRYWIVRPDDYVLQPGFEP